MSIDQQSPPTPQAPGPAGAVPAVPPPPQGTNGLSIAGFVLAFLIAPLGLILSIIGLVQAGGRRQKGKGLAIAGIIISVIVMAAGATLVLAVGDKVSTLADPGCTTGKSAILDNADKVSSPDTIKDGLQATIDGLTSAGSKAKHDNVRNAVKALDDDYKTLLQDINSGTAPDAGLQGKIDTDAAAIDSLCSIGTGK